MFECNICGNEYDEEYVVQKNKKKKVYTCIGCFEDKENFYWIKLFEKVRIINNLDTLDKRQITQLKRMNKENKMTFAGMYYCVGYMELIGKVATDEYDLIGLIPYYYDESASFWSKKWDIEEMFEDKEVEDKTNIIKTKVDFKKNKKNEDLRFDFLEDDDE